jgi:hypothetical protein
VFSLSSVPLFLKRLLADSRRIVMVTHVDAELICNKEQRGREE